MPIVYLVGFMGAGKTTVGRRLAELMGRRFVDLDERIEEHAGSSVRELFREQGEPYFRRIESEELERVSRESQIVVALGGGAFCDPDNQAVVAATGTSFWLDASLDLLCDRCGIDATRPLFTTRAEMAELLERRRPFYEQASHRISARGEVDEVASEILSRLSQYGNRVPSGS